MKGILTENDVRCIRSALVRNGFDCEATDLNDNGVMLDLVWSCADDDNAFEIACVLIKEVCPGINIRYVGGGVCNVKLEVRY